MVDRRQGTFGRSGTAEKKSTGLWGGEKNLNRQERSTGNERQEGNTTVPALKGNKLFQKHIARPPQQPGSLTPIYGLRKDRESFGKRGA